MKFKTCLIISLLLTTVTSAGSIRLPTNRAAIVTTGPFVAYDDGVTPLTSMTATNITCCLVKDSDAGGSGTAPTIVINTTLTASGGSNDFVHLTGDTVGLYSLELTAAQLNFTGRGKLVLSDPDVMCPWFTDVVVEPNDIYDTFVSGTTTIATAGEIQTKVEDGLAAYGASTHSAADVKTAMEAAGSHLTLILEDTGTTLPAAIPSAADNADAVWDEAISGHSGVGSTGEALAAASAPSAASVADAIWDELVADHSGVGSTGAALAAAGGSGDPWSTALPGAYGAGTAGKIIGDNLNTTVSSRSSHSAADVVTAIGTGSTLTALSSPKLNSGTVAEAGTTRSFTLSSGFPAVANAYPAGTVLTFVDATSGQTYAGRIAGYTAGRVVTMNPPLAVAPENADVVTIWPFFWLTTGF